MTPSRLPPGIAAILAFCFGVMGAVLGMAQVVSPYTLPPLPPSYILTTFQWFTGPIGKLCGTEYGGDIGFELAFAFTATSYLVLRTIEKHYFKR